MTEDSHNFSKEEDDTPLAGLPTEIAFSNSPNALDAFDYTEEYDLVHPWSCPDYLLATDSTYVPIRSKHNANDTI